MKAPAKLYKKFDKSIGFWSIHLEGKADDKEVKIVLTHSVTLDGGHKEDIVIHKAKGKKTAYQVAVADADRRIGEKLKDGYSDKPPVAIINRTPFEGIITETLEGTSSMVGRIAYKSNNYVIDIDGQTVKAPSPGSIYEQNIRYHEEGDLTGTVVIVEALLNDGKYLDPVIKRFVSE